MRGTRPRLCNAWLCHEAPCSIQCPKSYTGFDRVKNRDIHWEVVIDAHPDSRVELVEARERYLHAVFTTRMLRFRDDVEFLFDPEARVIHFRSASRVGYRDFGTNRRRMEHISNRFRELEGS